MNLYRRISTKTWQDCLKFLQSVNTSRLVESEKQLCKAKLAIEECWEALSAMESKKIPGNEGITKKFYQHFWVILGNFLVATLNYTSEKGKLSVLQKQCVITFNKKKDRDKRFNKDWRPISLLDVDVKIASKALANRVKTIILNLLQLIKLLKLKEGLLENQFKSLMS